MQSGTWDKCPSTTNAVERRNQDCSVTKPLHPKMAMMEAYRLDKVTCYKYIIAATEGTTISYQSKTDEARKANAAARRNQRKRKNLDDKMNEFGPPDKRYHLSGITSRKVTPRQLLLKLMIILLIFILTNIQIKVKVKYSTEAVIASFNCMTAKYAVYFPSDRKTEEFSLDEDGFIIEN